MELLLICLGILIAVVVHSGLGIAMILIGVILLLWNNRGRVTKG